jgi:L-threonylcarbamoyladenylate synthase
MDTRTVRIDPVQPEEQILAQAALLLLKGELVAFPTETVYGLGAHALDVAAIRKVYEVKGRPSRNPLIVHVPNADAAKTLVAEWPITAQKLAEKFWPGPLTLVLRKKSHVPSEVTGGGPLVALRVPSHPVALGLLREANIPLAAPSANTSGQLSPSDAAHVQKDLNGKIPMILDAGTCPGGIESTVIDLSEASPRVLRPGLLPLSVIEAVIGPVQRDIPQMTNDGVLPSPGMLTKHYSPKKKIFVIEKSKELIKKLLQDGKSIAWLPFEHTEPQERLMVVQMPNDPAKYATMLYATLHELDASACDMIVVELPPNTDAWLAVRDRLLRGAADAL